MYEIEHGSNRYEKISHLKTQEQAKAKLIESGKLYGENHPNEEQVQENLWNCLLYTSDAADDGYSVDLGGRRIIKKIFFKQKTAYEISEGLVGSEMCIRDSPDWLLHLSVSGYY